MASLQSLNPPPSTMETWPEACFKAYDIRGLANGDGTGELTLTSPTAWAAPWPPTSNAIPSPLGVTFATHHLRSPRNSWPVWPTVASRCGPRHRVTGCVYHACWTLPVNGGVMVTASHLPMPTHNGFKMCRGTLPLAGEEIQELKDVFLKATSRRAGEVIDHPHMDAYLDAIIASPDRWPHRQGGRGLRQRRARAVHERSARQDGR